MSSPSLPSHVNTAILGAGISGLTAAYFAKRSGQSVCLIESTNRAGGPIRSEKKEGFLIEYGPNTVLPSAELLDLVQELDLSDQMLLGDARLPRFVQVKGKLHRLPMSLKSFITTDLISKRGRLRLLAEPFLKRTPQKTDESLMAFSARRLGQEIAERMVAPFVNGVWAGDPEQLSAESSFPKLTAWERKKGSLFWGMLADRKTAAQNGIRAVPRGLLSFAGGLETLVQSLAKSLEEEIQFNQTVTSVSLEFGRWTISGSGFKFSADKLILCIPPDQAAQLIKSVSPEAAHALNEIPSAPLAVLHLSVRPSDVKSDLRAFGHLVAPSENLETLGCLYSSSIFSNRAPKDHALFTVFVGGARFPKILELSDQEILKKAVLALQPIMGLQRHPELIALTKYMRAIPQYTIGHGARVAALKSVEEKLPVKFGSNYMAGISVGDVIRRAKQLI